ncbi:MAG TPA: zf-HC2 domain-containing protein [Candidatus Dormibacteraeota bacterium]|jgi:predicted anti-sigma-YlaC factor YlaD|nr:zf-HC2 domain-containing protein [Candidatus Dormibacteraeota bacterium]
MSDQRALACARVRVLLEDYVDGDLATQSPELAAAVREHLAGCADCRRQHEQAVSLPFRLKALSSPEPRRSLTADVMRAIAPEQRGYRRAWTLLAPETVLAAFILWYLSGVDGLTSIASGIAGDLQSLVGWGAGGGSLPVVPGVDVLLLIALIMLTGIAGYHLSLLVKLAGGGIPARRVARE